MKKALLFSAVAATGLMLTQAHASLLTLTDNVDGAYDNTSSFTPVAYDSNLTTTGVSYEVPIYFQLSNLAAGESGFGGIDVTASLTQGAGGTATVDGYYFPNNPSFTTGKSSTTYYFTNSQLSTTLTSESEELVAAISGGVTSPTDDRISSMGTNSPFLLGDIYVDIPSGDSVSPTLNVVVDGYGTNNAGTLTEDFGPQGNGTGSVVNAAPITFLPEPASLSLLGIGAMGLLARKRRQA